MFFPVEQPVAGCCVYDAASFRSDAQPEIQSEILASIRSLQGEMQELRALVSDLHVHR